MGTTVARDDVARRVTVTMTGPLSASDILPLIETLRRPDVASYGVLWDAREVSLRFAPGDLGRIRATMVSADRGTPKPVRVAILATQDYLYSFAKVVAAAIGAAGYDIRAFKQLPDADAWLRDART